MHAINLLADSHQAFCACIRLFRYVSSGTTLIEISVRRNKLQF